MKVQWYKCYCHAACPTEAGFISISNDGGCFKIVLEALNWTQSQARCPQLDPRAHLAVITSAQQSEAIVNYTKMLDSSGRCSMLAILVQRRS